MKRPRLSEDQAWMLFSWAYRLVVLAALIWVVYVAVEILVRGFPLLNWFWWLLLLCVILVVLLFVAMFAGLSYDHGEDGCAIIVFAILLLILSPVFLKMGHRLSQGAGRAAARPGTAPVQPSRR